jgi:hypothetical protein
MLGTANLPSGTDIVSADSSLVAAKGKTGFLASQAKIIDSRRMR